LNFSRQSVTKGTIVLMSTTLISNTIGIVREIVVAKSFGVSVMYDAYAISLYLPSTIYAAFFYGMSNVFTPLYYHIKHNEGDFEAREFTSRFFGSWMVVTTLVILLLVAFTPVILSPFQSISDEIFSHIISMTRMLLIASNIGCYFVIFRSVLSAEKHFLHPSIATVFYNIVLIGFMVLFGSVISVYAMVYGSIIGMCSQLLYLYFVFRYFKVPIKLSNGFKNKQVIASLKLAIPIMGLEALWGVFYLVDGYFGSLNGSGSVSSLNYASTIFRFPGYLIGISISSALLPSLSELANSGSLEMVRDIISKGLRLILFISTVMTITFFLFGDKIIGLVLERGAFDQDATQRTAQILKYLSLGFFILIAFPIIGRIANVYKFNTVMFMSFLAGIAVKIILYFSYFYRFSMVGVSICIIIGLCVALLIPTVTIQLKISLFRKNDLVLLIGACIVLLFLVVLSPHINRFLLFFFLQSVCDTLFWRELQHSLKEVRYQLYR